MNVLQNIKEYIVDILDDIELFDCPFCHGTGLIQEENGWCLYAVCLDCGAFTAEIPFKSEEEKIKVARHVARMWNIGKVISCGPGE